MVGAEWACWAASGVCAGGANVMDDEIGSHAQQTPPERTHHDDPHRCDRAMLPSKSISDY